MVLISRVGPVPRPGPVSRAQQVGSTSFTVPDSVGGADARPQLSRAGMATAISNSMVLALQEQVGRDDADEDGRRHGHRVLDELARLQRALLSGEGGASLQDLEGLARMQPGDVDPALAGVLSSIRLRARIELERRSRRPDAV